jgi:hypothetical protein
MTSEKPEPSERDKQIANDWDWENAERRPVMLQRLRSEIEREAEERSGQNDCEVASLEAQLAALREELQAKGGALQVAVAGNIAKDEELVIARKTVGELLLMAARGGQDAVRLVELLKERAALREENERHRAMLPAQIERAEMALGEVARLCEENERLKAEHCKDCCCARSWRVLGIEQYMGKSIPEHIEMLLAERDAALTEAGKQAREAGALQAALDGLRERARLVVRRWDELPHTSGSDLGIAISVLRDALAEPQGEQHPDLIESAWIVIANAGGGDWTRETPEWQKAAHRWGVQAGFRAEQGEQPAQKHEPNVVTAYGATTIDGCACGKPWPCPDAEKEKR